jgi:starch phosphorylase
MILKDFDAYVACQERIGRLYRDPEAWSRMAALNVAGSGKFSSDRTIRQYASEIWGVEAVNVPAE